MAAWFCAFCTILHTFPTCSGVHLTSNSPVRRYRNDTIVFLLYQTMWLLPPDFAFLQREKFVACKTAPIYLFHVYCVFAWSSALIRICILFEGFNEFKKEESCITICIVNKMILYRLLLKHTSPILLQGDREHSSRKLVPLHLWAEPCCLSLISFDHLTRHLPDKCAILPSGINAS